MINCIKKVISQMASDSMCCLLDGSGEGDPVGAALEERIATLEQGTVMLEQGTGILLQGFVLFDCITLEPGAVLLAKDVAKSGQGDVVVKLGVAILEQLDVTSEQHTMVEGSALSKQGSAPLVQASAPLV